MTMIGVRIAAPGLALAVLCSSHTQALSGCDWDGFYSAGGHIIIIGISCGGRPRRSIPKPRPLTLHKIARQAYSTLS
jgi:hypothetical protein